MALSEDNKIRIAIALCYPGTITTEGNVNYNSVFVDRVTNIPAYVETRAVEILTKIDAIDSKLESSPTKSNIKRIDEIEFDTSMSFDLIRKESRRLRNELSNLLDIPNKCGGSGGMCVSVCR